MSSQSGRQAYTLSVVRPDWPAPATVHAHTTTRRGGVSEGPWTSLNLGARCGDSERAVAANRRRISVVLPSQPCWLDQVHGARVVTVAAGEPRGAEADAAVTREPGAVCAVLTADCLPVVLCDRAGAAVGVAHAGWRGLAAGVLEATVAEMGTPGDLLAWLGPAIGPAAFEVGDDVRAAFVDRDPHARAAFERNRRGRWQADLFMLARRRLAAAGVSAVYGGKLCTWSDPGRFFSYRRDGNCGRMATLVWIASATAAGGFPLPRQCV